MTAEIISLVIPCFNEAASALTTVLAVGGQRTEHCYTLEAIVVDDASTDDGFGRLVDDLPSWARVVRAPKNLGRAGAINLGASYAIGKYLLFLDCDCLPLRDDFLQKHLELMSTGADASVGNIVVVDEGFWGRYQSMVAERRGLEAARTGAAQYMTTANVLMLAAVFHASGGFDSRYRHYGFEDRDFLLRLQRRGARLAYNPGAPVDHAANLDFPGISTKMQACGRHSARLFRVDHAQAYRDLGYRAIDSTLNPVRAALLMPLARLVVSRAQTIETLLQHNGLPYWLRAWLARVATALAYMRGTRLERDPTLV